MIILNVFNYTMLSKKTNFYIFFLVAALIVSGGYVVAKYIFTRQTVVKSADLTATQVLNATYDLSANFAFQDDKAVELHDGAARYTSPETFNDKEQQIYKHEVEAARLNNQPIIALGDVNGDGAGDAAVFLVASSTDRNGYVVKLMRLEVLISKNGKPSVIDGVNDAMADSLNYSPKQIKGITISNQIISVVSDRDQVDYKLVNDNIVKAAVALAVAPPPLTWKNYHNDLLGVAMRHPNDFIIKAAANAKDSDAEFILPASYYHLPYSAQPNASISLSVAASTFRECIHDSISANYSPTPVTINGIDFYKGGYRGVCEEGRCSNSVSYHIYRDNRCYKIVLLEEEFNNLRHLFKNSQEVTDYNYEKKDWEIKSVFAADNNQVDKIFDQMMSTLVFDN